MEIEEFLEIIFVRELSASSVAFDILYQKLDCRCNVLTK